MTISKSVHFSFGQVEIKKEPRSKYLRLRVHPEKGIRISMPMHYTYSQAIDFVNSKENWIRKSLAKNQEKKKQTTVFDHTTQFCTKKHCLQIKTHKKLSLKYQISTPKLYIWYPESVDTKNEKVQSFIRKAITETLRLEAQELLPGRTNYFASKYNLGVEKVAVRNNKTRWGSCSGKNAISLNVQLMRLPDKLIDYVILHELAHIKHKNHSKQFWAYLESICTGSKQLDKSLNNYHPVYW